MANEYKIAIKIAGKLDKSLASSIKQAQAQLNGLNGMSFGGMQKGLFSAMNAFAKNPSSAMKGFADNLLTPLKNIEGMSAAEWEAAVGTAPLQVVNKTAQAGMMMLAESAKITAQATAAAMGASVAAVAAGGVASIKAGMDFESAFAGVRKTVDATEPELAALETGIRNLARQMPTSATEIAGVAEAAGQLGIQTGSILGFTETMVQLGDATNMSAEEAATSLARMANITGMPQSEFSRLGSTVVALGNNLATTESEIVNMSLRLAGAGSQVGMSEAQILSFAGALSSVGIEAEAGGSAFSKVMIGMQLATETGGESLENFARVAGMTSGEFKTAFQTDAAGAMQSFIQGLATAEQRGQSAIGVLNEMGISEVRMRDALLRAAGASDVFSDALRIGSDAWTQNTALANEATQRYATMESQMSILRNKVTDLGIGIYQGLNVPMAEAVASANAMMDELSAAFSSGGFDGLIQAAGQVIPQMIAGFMQGIPQMLSVAQQLMTSFMSGILQAAPQLAGAAVQIIAQLAMWFFSAMPQILQVGMQLIIYLLQGLVSAAPMLVQGALTCIQQFISFFVANLPMIITLGIELIGQLVVGIIQAIPMIISAIPEITKAIWDGILNVDWISLGVEIISAIGKGILSVGKTLGETVLSCFTGGGQAALDREYEMIMASTNTGAATTQALGQGITSGASTIQAAGQTVGTQATTSIATGMTSGISTITGISANVGTRTATSLTGSMTAQSGALNTSGVMAINALGTGMQTGGTGLMTTANTIGMNSMTALGNGINTGAATISGSMDAVKNTMTSSMTDCWTQMNSQATTAFASLNGVVQTGMTTINSTISQAFSTSITNTITTQMTAIQTQITTAFTTLNTLLTTHITSASMAITAGFTTITATITSNVTTITTLFTTTYSNLLMQLNTTLTSAGAAISAQLAAWIAMMSAYGAQAVALAASIGQQIIATFMAVDLSGAGAHMIQGLISGMESMRGAVIATAQSIAAEASAAMSAALKIGSPSKVTAEFGRFMDLGLVEGMTSAASGVKQAAERVAGIAAQPMTGNGQATGLTAPSFNTQAGLFDSVLEWLSGGGMTGGNSMQDNSSIVYSPTNHYHFDGGTPSRDEIAAAEAMTMDRFRQMLEENEWQGHRISFG